MEKWINILQNYDGILTVAAVLVMGLILEFYLIRILRQIKRLNLNLGSITQNIQEYFDVIMQEEPQIISEEKKEPEPVMIQSKEESVDSESLVEQELRKQEEEKVFNAVLQEYFS